MLIYSYACAARGAETDILMALAAERDTQGCPACDSQRPRRKRISFAVGKTSGVGHGGAPHGSGQCPPGACASCPSQQFS